MTLISTKALTILLYSSLVAVSQGLESRSIPHRQTPAPGHWPQDNVAGCGFPSVPFTGLLSRCSIPLVDSAPDIRGFWRKTSDEAAGSKAVEESIEMCADRWISASTSAMLDFYRGCSGYLVDGAKDYDPDIIRKSGRCKSLKAACRFERDSKGNKCVNVYEPKNSGGLARTYSRCLQPNGTMILTHPRKGTVLYNKVPKKEAPNCMKCVSGEHDGVTSMSSEDELPCGYSERAWVRCPMPGEVEKTKVLPEVVAFFTAIALVGGMILL